MLFVKVLLFTLLVPGTVTVVIPYLLLRYTGGLQPPPAQSARWLGLLPLLPGVGIYLWCARDFAVRGKGTPAPHDPPALLVTEGLYRFTRNPMYVGIVLVLFGETALFASYPLLVYATLVLLAVHLRVVYYEEPTLRQKFGAAYEEYRRAVPRWPRRRRL